MIHIHKSLAFTLEEKIFNFPLFGTGVGEYRQHQIFVKK